MIIILDAMGGDNAPDATIKGAVRAINQIEADILLVGNKDVINQKVKEFYARRKQRNIRDTAKQSRTTVQKAFRQPTKAA